MKTTSGRDLPPATRAGNVGLAYPRLKAGGYRLSACYARVDPRSQSTHVFRRDTTLVDFFDQGVESGRQLRKRKTFEVCLARYRAELDVTHLRLDIELAECSVQKEIADLTEDVVLTAQVARVRDDRASADDGVRWPSRRFGRLRMRGFAFRSNERRFSLSESRSG